ncbi:VanW family protein [Candidatus Uhrbacteria bacterium]|nr:VanW family protein [Candidatus Uhrbacteria bacterium]
MTLPSPDHESILSAPASGGFWTPVRILIAALVAVVAVSSGAYVWAQSYDGKIPPRMSVAGRAVGGQDPETVRALLQERVDAILVDGIPLTVEGETKNLTLATFVSGDLIEDVEFDVEALLTALMASHHENPLVDTLRMLSRAAWGSDVQTVFTLEEERIKQRARELFPDREILSQDAAFAITPSGEDWVIDVVEGRAGREFVWEPFLVELNARLSRLDGSGLALSLADATPEVSLELAASQAEQARAALLGAPYSATLSDEDRTWSMTSQDLVGMLAPGNDGAIILKESAFEEWASSLLSEVNQATQDARLVVENGRVTEFVESRAGKSVDEDALMLALTVRVRSVNTQPVELIVNTQEPAVKTSEVNDLGIAEVLGVGMSSYRGSPTNRRANIQNGVRLLNGILIAPGETFSLLSALSPFTTDNGYLPELVIKGDKITPELGGGLCQIGTTTFRAAMNAGLPIVERQNHSLVVSYYNDPSNGNPGTDATIYEPAPDFKFLNDTGNYILFQAENLTSTQDLRFTFWGTSDGRAGSYSPPVVERWIPVGETSLIETTDLEPGEKKCQAAHVGADASFVYTVVKADGQIEETTFTSHYRPLPEICLVGVEEEAVDPGDNLGESSTVESEPTTE